MWPKPRGNSAVHLGHYRESENYNPNDLGYLAAPNEIVTYGNLEYGIYQPFGAFNRMWWNLNVDLNHLYAPRGVQQLDIGVPNGRRSPGRFGSTN